MLTTKPKPFHPVFVPNTAKKIPNSVNLNKVTESELRLGEITQFIWWKRLKGPSLVSPGNVFVHRPASPLDGGQ